MNMQSLISDWATPWGISSFIVSRDAWSSEAREKIFHGLYSKTTILKENSKFIKSI